MICKKITILAEKLLSLKFVVYLILTFLRWFEKIESHDYVVFTCLFVLGREIMKGYNRRKINEVFDEGN